MASPGSRRAGLAGAVLLLVLLVLIPAAPPAARGEGPEMSFPTLLSAGGSSRILVLDPEAGTTWSVDLQDGDRRPGGPAPAEFALEGDTLVATGDPGRLVSGPGRGEGPPLEAPNDFVIADDGRVYVLLDSGLVLSVFPPTGDRRVAADLGRGPGPVPLEPRGLARGLRPGTLLVADYPTGRILEVDLAAGARRLVLSPDRTPGAPLHRAFDVLALPDGRLVVSDPAQPALLVTGRAGSLRLLSGSSRPRPWPVVPGSVRRLPGGGGLLVTDLLGGRLLRVDPHTGAAAPLPGPAGRRGAFRLPVAVDVSPGAAWVASPPDGVARVDLAGGGLEWVLGPDEVEKAADVLALAPGRLLVLDFARAVLLEADGRGGPARVLRGSGPPFRQPARLYRGDGVLVGDPGAGVVFEVDPDTGDRRVAARGPGPQQVLAPAQVPGGPLYFTNPDGSAVLTARSVVSGPGRGRGPLPDTAEDLEILGDGTLLVADAGRGALLRIDPAPGDRAVLLLVPTAAPALPGGLAAPRARVRWNAVLRLGAERDASAVPDLVQALEDPHPNVRLLAAWALGRVREPAAAPALVRLLETTPWDEAPPLVAYTAWALGEIGDPRARPALLVLLRDSRDTGQREEALKALARLQGPPSLGLFIGQARDPDENLRVLALQLLASAARSSGETRRAATVLEALAGDPDPEVREAARHTLEALRDHRPLPLPGTEEVEAWPAGEVGSLDSEDLLLANLVDFHPLGQAPLAFATRLDLPDLLAALGHPSRDRRRNAALLLGNRPPGDPRVVEALVGAARDPDSGLRWAAVKALGKQGDPGALDALLEACGDDDKDVREDAVEALGRIRGAEADPRVLPRLEAALQEPWPSVRAAALRALSRFRGAASRRLIQGALEDPEPHVRRQALEALAARRDLEEARPLRDPPDPAR